MPGHALGGELSPTASSKNQPQLERAERSWEERKGHSDSRERPSHQEAPPQHGSLEAAGHFPVKWRVLTSCTEVMRVRLCFLSPLFREAIRVPAIDAVPLAGTAREAEGQSTQRRGPAAQP